MREKVQPIGRIDAIKFAKTTWATTIGVCFNSKIGKLEQHLVEKAEEAKQLQEVISTNKRQFEEQVLNTDKNQSEWILKLQSEKKLRDEEVLKSQKLASKIETLSLEVSAKCFDVEAIKSELETSREKV